jgi:hypothetical protein
MKKRFPFAIGLVLFIASVCIAQTQTTPSPSPSPKPKPAMSKAQIQNNLIATEKKLWEAWKNKDVKPFKAALLTDAIAVSNTGVDGREATLKSIADSDCKVNSYSLSDFKLTMLSADVAVLTYKGTQDATCGGTTVPAAVWASSVFVRRGGKWYAATHQETPAKQ